MECGRSHCSPHFTRRLKTRVTTATGARQQTGAVSAGSRRRRRAAAATIGAPNSGLTRGAQAGAWSFEERSIAHWAPQCRLGAAMAAVSFYALLGAQMTPSSGCSRPFKPFIS